jgi:hypothetical protein
MFKFSYSLKSIIENFCPKPIEKPPILSLIHGNTMEEIQKNEESKIMDSPKSFKRNNFEFFDESKQFKIDGYASKSLSREIEFSEKLIT